MKGESQASKCVSIDGVFQSFSYLAKLISRHVIFSSFVVSLGSTEWPKTSGALYLHPWRRRSYHQCEWIINMQLQALLQHYIACLPKVNDGCTVYYLWWYNEAIPTPDQHRRAREGNKKDYRRPWSGDSIPLQVAPAQEHVRTDRRRTAPSDSDPGPRPTQNQIIISSVSV